MAMKEDYCDYELSKALKAAGFDEPCLTFYDANKELGRALDPDNFNHLGETYQGEWFTDTISAPSLYTAQKWLREKWGIDVDVRTTKIPKRKYGYVVYDKTQHFSHEEYYAYEQALSAGITAALELIKKGE